MIKITKKIDKFIEDTGKSPFLELTPFAEKTLLNKIKVYAKTQGVDSFNNYNFFTVLMLKGATDISNRSIFPFESMKLLNEAVESLCTDHYGYMLQCKSVSKTRKSYCLNKVMAETTASIGEEPIDATGIIYKTALINSGILLYNIIFYYSYYIYIIIDLDEFSCLFDDLLLFGEPLYPSKQIDDSTFTNSIFESCMSPIISFENHLKNQISIQNMEILKTNATVKGYQTPDLMI